MPRRFISDLQAGERIDDVVFLVRSKDLRTTTQGGLYIHAVLCDRTGELPARIWQATEELFQGIPSGGYVRIKGRAENYKGSMQVIIDAIRGVEMDGVDPSEFLPATKADVEVLWKRLRQILGQISHRDLAELVSEFLGNDALMSRFRRAPAAVNLHHAYLGGLLEHTVQLLELALRVIPLYPKLNLDLVLTGIFLHDIGKTAELSYETNIGYTDEGQLLGHIVQGAIWVDRCAEAVSLRTGRPFPQEVLWAVQHIIVSHHGKYEFGSPRLPATPEAVAVHYLDNLDAKVHIFLAEIAGSRDPENRWTTFNRAIETRVFKQGVAGEVESLTPSGNGSST